MARFYVDCRDVPSDSDCTVKISADSKEEILEAAMQHAMAVHDHEDTPAFRDDLSQAIQQAATA